MPDHRRRRVERSALRGDPQAARRLLVERLRAGELSRARLELAAHLGHAASAAVVDVAPGDLDFAREREFDAWLDQLGAADEGEAALRAGLAALVLLRQHVPPRPGWEERTGEVIRALEDWIVAPPDARRGPMLRLARAFAADRAAPDHHDPAAAAAEVDPYDLEEGPLARVLDAQGQPALSRRMARNVASLCAQELRQASQQPLRAGGPRAFRRLTRLRAVQVIAAAIQTALLPWAVGEGDPVRERVAQRGGGR